MADLAAARRDAQWALDSFEAETGKRDFHALELAHHLRLLLAASPEPAPALPSVDPRIAETLRLADEVLTWLKMDDGTPCEWPAEETIAKVRADIVAALASLSQPAPALPEPRMAPSMFGVGDVPVCTMGLALPNEVREAARNVERLILQNASDTGEYHAEVLRLLAAIASRGGRP